MPHACGKCGKEFLREDNFNVHMAAHMKGFDCPVCFKPSHSKEDLQTHHEGTHGTIGHGVQEPEFTPEFTLNLRQEKNNSRFGTRHYI